MQGAAIVHVTVRRSQVALFCSPGVSESTQTHWSKHTLTAAGTDVVILGCVRTESRLAGERVCVCVMTLGFFFALRFKVWSHMCWRSSQSISEKYKNTGGKVDGKQGQREQRQRSPTNSYMHARTHTHTKEMSHQ